MTSPKIHDLYDKTESGHLVHSGYRIIELNPDRFKVNYNLTLVGFECSYKRACSLCHDHRGAQS